MTSTSVRSLNRPQFATSRSMSDFIFIPHSGIINRPVEEHFQHLQQFQLPHDFNSAVHDRFALQEIPKIFLGENDGLHKLAERDVLPGTPRSNVLVALLD